MAFLARKSPLCPVLYPGLIPMQCNFLKLSTSYLRATGSWRFFYPRHHYLPISTFLLDLSLMLLRLYLHSAFPARYLTISTPAKQPAAVR